MKPASSVSSGSGGVGGSVVRRTRKPARPARRLTRRAVLKMLAVMEQSDSNHDAVQDFLSTGRTGRRNAMPDILSEDANTSTAELPACLQKLTAHDPSTSEATSSTEVPPSGNSNSSPPKPKEAESEKTPAETSS